MILIYVWAFVVVYFFVLWSAVGLEMAVAGSVIFVFFALKLTVTALGLLSSTRQTPDHQNWKRSGHQPPPANQNHC